MEYNFNNWPFRWYGIWKEYGKGYEAYPSINDFVNRSVNEEYDIEKLTQYLDAGIVVSSTSSLNFPSPFSKKISHGSISFRTDGKWLWLDNITEFVRYNNLVIPTIWFNEIKKEKFRLNNNVEINLETLEWPNW